MRGSSPRYYCCPQHRCTDCARTTEQLCCLGGLLRCSYCPKTWCGACIPHWPDGYRIISLAADSPLRSFIVCGDCMSRPGAPVCEEHRQPEPTQPLDLSAHENTVGVEQSFDAFLDGLARSGHVSVPA
eukprot:UN3866